MYKFMVKTSGLFLFLLLSVSIQGQQKKSASAIIIDNTGSMRQQLEYVLTMSGEAGKVLLQRGTVSIFSFEFHLDGKKELGSLNGGSAWLSDSKNLWNKINTIKIEPGQTQLIDALDSARGVIASKVLSEHLDEGIIFLITDGEDRASDGKVDKLIQNLKASQIKVFAIGLVDDVTDKKKATKLLKRLASETAGNAIFPKFKELQSQQSFEPLIAKVFAPPEPSK